MDVWYNKKKEVFYRRTHYATIFIAQSPVKKKRKKEKKKTNEKGKKKETKKIISKNLVQNGRRYIENVQATKNLNTNKGTKMP